jgi:hypothetical protein
MLRNVLFFPCKERVRADEAKPEVRDLQLATMKKLFEAREGSREEYRTDGLTPALAIILQKSKGLQNEKTGNIVISENVSGDVPKAGVEPTTFALRMPYLSKLTAKYST